MDNACSPTPAFERISAFESLHRAWQRASAGKRHRASTAAFEHRLADQLLDLQTELRSGRYAPSAYTHFVIHEPKRRLISAAPFRDRVVHHALCAEIEPRFERVFLPESFANRLGKGTHAALAHVRQLAARFRFVLRLDIRQHFPSIDHAILTEALAVHVPESDLMALVRTILSSGEAISALEPQSAVYFDGDDLWAANRPRGLPIGNLTSQFWSNVYLHPLDLFVRRTLGCRGYARYVDDFTLFADEAAPLWAWKAALCERLTRLRLRMHEGSAPVAPCSAGIPWLGFVVYPDGVKVKARKVRHTTRHLHARYAAWQTGRISFGEFDASVQGWLNHVRHADSLGLRAHMLTPFELPAGFQPQYRGRGRARGR
jgi:RNA-directed DNA polymerase